MAIIQQTKLARMILSLALLLLFSFSNQALAVNAQLFRPLPEGMGVVTVHGANALEQGQSSFGIYVNYAAEPLEFALTPNGEQVKWFLTSDVLLGVGLKDWLTLFADLPVSISTLEDFPSGLDTNEVLFGDISLGASLRLMGGSDRFGIALIPFLTAPTGRVSEFHGEETMTGGGKLAIDFWLGKQTYFALNGGYRYRDEETIGAFTIKDVIEASIAGQWFFSEERQHSLFVESFGSSSPDDLFGTDELHPIEVIGGFKFITDERRWNFTLGGGVGVTDGYGAPEYRVFSGVTYWAKPKTQPPPPVVAPVEPPPPVEEKSTKATIQVTIADTTKTAVAGKIGLFTSDNKLITKAEGGSATWTVDPGTYKVVAVAAGFKKAYQEVMIGQGESQAINLTMESTRARIQRDHIAIEPIFFQTGSPIIKQESLPVLDDVASLLKGRPEIKKVRIEGHTDNRGGYAINQKISYERALNVQRYLIQQGIDPVRLTAVGYGPDRPIASQDTPTGRAKNRRVELVIVESESTDQ